MWDQHPHPAVRGGMCDPIPLPHLLQSCCCVLAPRDGSRPVGEAGEEGVGDASTWKDQHEALSGNCSSGVRKKLHSAERTGTLISWHRLSACPSLLALAPPQPHCLGRHCPPWWPAGTALVGLHARGMGKWPRGKWACQALSCNSSTLCFIKNFFPA